MDFVELEQGACSHLCKHMPTKLCVMVEAGLDHSRVPAFADTVMQHILSLEVSCHRAIS